MGHKKHFKATTQSFIKERGERSIGSYTVPVLTRRTTSATNCFRGSRMAGSAPVSLAGGTARVVSLTLTSSYSPASPNLT